MRTAVIIATLVLAAPLAHAAEIIPGFFDIQKAMADSAEGKKNAADEKADLDKKQAEVTAAQGDAEKADAACLKVPSTSIPGTCTEGQKKHAHANDLGQRDQQELTQGQQANAQKLLARVTRILPAIAKAKHLGALVPLGGVFYAGPTLDMTAEVTRRLDAGEGKVDDVAAANARAEKAEARALAAEAEVERVRKLGLKAVGLAKTALSERDKATAIATDAVDLSRRVLGADAPAAPSVAPPSPTQPLASKGKK